MQTGDIVIVAFPFTDMDSFKARPAVVITQLTGNYNDVIVSLISSVIKENSSPFEMLVQPNKVNNLKVISTIKVERITTVDQNKIIAVIGKLSTVETELFKTIFKSLVD